MGKILEDLLEAKCKDLLKASTDIHETVIIALKEKLQKDIKEEIIKEEADRLTKEYKKKILDEKIKQLKVLFFTGIIVSFFMGLLVNQVTELLSICKGTLNKEALAFTLIAVSIISAIVISLIIYLLFSSIVDFIKGENNEGNTNE